MGRAKRPSTGQVPSWIIAPPRSVGAWSKSGKDGNIVKITRSAKYGGVFTLLGRKASKSWDSSRNARGGQQEVEGGEGQANRMRHALPQAVIHLHTDYAVLFSSSIFLSGALALQE